MRDDAAAAVDAALAHAFPDRDATRVALREGFTWNHTAVAEFTTGDPVYVKVAVDGDGARITRQDAASRYAAARTPVVTPESLAVAPSPPDGVLPYLVTAPHPGTALEEEWTDAGTERRCELLRGVGATLAALHADRFAEPGRIVGGNERGLELEVGPWPDVLDARLARRERHVPERFPDALPVVRDALRARRTALEGSPAALVHDDARGNCFRDPWGFIDWETAVVGDPALDVVRAEWGYVDRPDVADRDRLRRALHAGYRTHAGSLPDGFDAHEPIYAAVAFLYTVFSFERWAPDAPGSVDEHADWVRTELRARAARATG